MEYKKIIIISASESLRNFFKLEALNFDFSVDCVEKIDISHNDFSDYDLMIIDKDTIKQLPLNGAKKELSVSAQGEKSDMVYPCLISELRRVYNDLYTKNVVADKKSDNNVIKIIFYKNENNLVSINKRKFILSDTEYKILTVLCENAPNAVSRAKMQELFENGKGNISDVYICKLRKKLEEPLGQRLIFTVREEGYKIITESEWR